MCVCSRAISIPLVVVVVDYHITVARPQDLDARARLRRSYIEQVDIRAISRHNCPQPQFESTRHTVYLIEL
jgi:hypothetical protein